MRRYWHVTIWICLLAGISLVGLCFAGEGDKSKTLAPYFFVEGEESSLDRFPLKQTKVIVAIDGVIADVRVRQRYTNQGGQPINGRYIFPASTRAAVHGMTMTIGDRVIRAEIKRKEKAREIFTKAKASGKSASLLSQHRPNVFSMDVANIMPGDTVDIELHYSELLVPEDKIYSFVFPTVVGPRYSSEPAGGTTDHWIANPYLKEGNTTPATIAMDIHLATGMDIRDLSSPSHQVESSWQGKDTCEIRLAPGEESGGNRDFILRYRLAGEEVAAGLMLHKGKEENFFLLMVQPPERIEQLQIPPREYLFVVDVSGSMHGFPLNTAKKMLSDLIGSLNSNDLFNVLLFSGASRVMSPRSIEANGDNIRKALRFIDQEQGGGGTELNRALHTALNLPSSEDYSRTMVVITDGYIQAEKETFQQIRENLNRGNLFAFGIGTSVNRYLIEGLARAGQGEPFIVTGPDEAPAIAERFRKMISTPVLTDVRIDYDGFSPYDVEPPSLPDLFADRPVLLFGKWQGEAGGTITLHGKTGGGEEVTRSFVLNDDIIKTENQPLQILWARQRLMRISDHWTGRGDTNKDEIAELGLKYNLLSSQTSFVAVHEVIRNPGGLAKDIKQPLPLPQGVSNLAVGVHQTPEPELWLLLGITAAVFILLRSRRRRFNEGKAAGIQL